ncbi:MAG: MotA/TolQ/ExbB proton channel family protein [Halobacteriovoraceae bacterium]|nr:MotA/TolQ/ExbB proton channel family protein [Halobacteriovoraceae bacterium]
MEETSLNIWQIIWQSCLVVKLVLLSLVAASIISWAIIIKKYKSMQIVDQNNLSFMDIFNSMDDLQKIKIQSENLPPSLFKTIFEHGHEELEKIWIKTEEKDPDAFRRHFEYFGITSLQRSLQKGININNTKLDSLLAILASIGSISPFVGLFGTVWGIIDSFKGLASGGSTLDAVAPGIAEALVATAVGLAAAIPAVWFYNYFSNKNGRINSEMENFKEDFLNMVERSFI